MLTKTPKGLEVVFDENCERLLLTDDGIAIAFFNKNEGSWERFPKRWLLKPGSANPVSEETIDAITEGISPSPDEFHSAREMLRSYKQRERGGSADVNKNT